MGLFDRWKKKKDEDDDDDLTPMDKKTIEQMYNKKIKDSKEKVYWNTGVCWKCGQTMDKKSEYCWECGTKYKPRQ